MWGNIEIVNGGWDLHDEACPSYQDILTNLYKGQQYLYDEFWYFPRSAVSFNAEAHSETNARLLSESGMDALFLLSVDPQERAERLKKKSMEFIWRPHMKHLGRTSEIYTHVFYDFDMSPFDLDVQDPPQKHQNGSAEYEYEVDRDEWDRFWDNGTNFDDWWWGNDTFDNDTIDWDDDDWWNWDNDTDTWEEEDENDDDVPDLDIDEDMFNVTDDFLNATSNTSSTNSTTGRILRRMLKAQSAENLRLQ